MGYAIVACLALCNFGCGGEDETNASPMKAGALFAPKDIAATHAFPVVFIADDATLSAQFTLYGGAAAVPLNVYRGRGSAMVTAREAGELTLKAQNATSETELTIVATDRPILHVSGQMQNANWNADADIVVDADLRVEALTIAAGTRVRLAKDADIAITGEIIATGEPAQPIVFTSNSAEQAWGGLHFLPGSTGQLLHTWFLQGGGDPSQVFGHSQSQAVVMADGAAFSLDGGGVIDSPGKAFGSNSSEISLHSVMIARCDTGGEFSETALDLRDSHITEIPDGDGSFDDDDNDGIYLHGVLKKAGNTVSSHISNIVFARGEDDAIDHNGAEVTLESVWISDFRHEGIAASTGGHVFANDVVIQKCEQGVEAGYGAPQVLLRDSLLTQCGVGVRFGDSYDMPSEGQLHVENSVITGNQQNVKNHVNVLNGPRPGAIQISCSYLDPADMDEFSNGTNRFDAALDGVCLASDVGGLSNVCADKTAGPATCPFGPP